MSYSESLTIAIPAALYDTACAIARALDPDVGGHLSYGPKLDEATDYTTSTPCTPAFKAQAMQLLALPEALHQVVSADYATRWPDLVTPTLEECTLFCQHAIIEKEIECATLPLTFSASE